MDTVNVAFINNVAHSLPLSNLDIQVSRYIGCQFALESNFGNSHLAKSMQNYCGMKHPNRRPTLSYGSYKEFACYMSIDDCCIDYCFWLSYCRCPQSALCCFDEFRAWLSKSGYCPEPTYISKIDKIYDSYCLTLNSLL